MCVQEAQAAHDSTIQHDMQVALSEMNHGSWLIDLQDPYVGTTTVPVVVTVLAVVEVACSAKVIQPLQVAHPPLVVQFSVGS